MRAFWRISAITALVFAASSAQAAIVNYNEFADGDLDASVTLDFDMAGTHTVLGFFGSGDEDSFLFNVGAGLALTGFQVSATGFPVSGVTSATAGLEINPNPGTGPFYASEFDFIANSLTVGMPLSAALDAGSYRFDNSIASVSGSETARFGARYSLTFTVEESLTPAPVPLPASFFPLIAAMGGLFALRRSRR